MRLCLFIILRNYGDLGLEGELGTPGTPGGAGRMDRSGGPAPANSGWLSLRLLLLLLAMMPILLEQCERQYLVSLRRT